MAERWGGAAESLEARRLARAAVLQAVQEAEGVIDRIMAGVRDRRSREELSRAVEAYMEAHGEPRFRIVCYRCRGTVLEVPLVYPSARGLWTWLPPAYLVARFNSDDAYRRCSGCGASFEPVDLRAGDEGAG